MASSVRLLGHEAIGQRMKMSGAGQGGADLGVKTWFLVGLIMLARRVLPDHRAMLRRECHTAPLNADGSVSTRGLMGPRLG